MSNYCAHRIHLVAAALTLVALVASSAQGQGNRLPVAGDISLALPAGWSEVSGVYRNARVLVPVPAGEQSGLRGPWSVAGDGADPARLWTARTTVNVEQRLHAADAWRRLADIARERRGTVDYLSAAGAPALRRRAVGTLPAKRDAPPPPTVFRSFAIAFGDRVVRVETILPPADEARLAPALEALEASLRGTSTPLAEIALADVLAELRSGALATPPATPSRIVASPAAPEGSPGPAVFARSGAETEVAASANGSFVVVSAQSRWASSDDGGVSYDTTGTMPFSNYGDPSLTRGASGRFYYAGILNSCNPSNNGCSTAIAVSSDNAQTFQTTTNAVDCPADPDPAACFPDQEHIAADRFNLSGGNDQVYSVWRNFAASLQPAIVCSSDGGASWSATAAVDVIGDWPRVSVASDGFVYVTYATDPVGIVLIHKFSSCASGLNPQAGFPVAVSAYTGVPCPLSGNDRCDGRQTAASFQAAAEDGAPGHLFVSFANSTGGGNEDVLVFDSLDGGLTWPRSVVLNGGPAARRYFPWLCTVDNRAVVGWFDRRPANGGASNDLVQYWAATAFDQGGSLVAGAEQNVFATTDAACAAGWPCDADLASYAESCTVQPQLAGSCSVSGARCDFSDGCPPGQSCLEDRGCPKFGDYTGIACGGGWAFYSWSSATPPPGVGSVPAGINTYMSAILHRTAADLRILKADNVDPVAPLQNFVYSLAVTNLAASTLAREITVNDNLPAGLTFQGISAPGWSCATPAIGAGGAIQCTLGALAGGSSASTIFVTVRAAADGPVQNVGTVTEVPTDPAAANNTDNESTTIISPDLAIVSITDSPDPALPLAQITWTVTIENQGPTQARNLVFEDPLPPGTTFVGAAGPGWNCAGPPIGDNGTVFCQLATLNSGVTAGVLTIAANAPDAIVDLVNTVSVEAETNDPDDSDNSASATTAVRSPSDVTATKIVTSPDEWHQAGGAVEWTVVLANAGPGAQFDNPGNEFEDPIDPIFTVSSLSATLGTAAVVDNLVTWNGKLPANATVEIVIHGDLPTTGTGGTFWNQGTVLYDADGEGTNESLRLSDDPAQDGEADPTPVYIRSILEIPALGRVGFALLALALALFALARFRKARGAASR